MGKTKNRWLFIPHENLKEFRVSVVLVSGAMLLALTVLRGSAQFFARLYSNIFLSYYAEIIRGRSGSLAFLSAEENIINAYNDFVTISASVFTFVLVCLFLRFIHKRTGGERAEEMKFRLAMPKKPLYYIIFGFSVFYLFYYISEYIYIGAAMSFGIEKTLPPDFGFPDTAGGILLHIFAAAVVPAVFEELTFRFFMLNILKRYGNIFAIVVSSLFFGLLHASYNAFFYATAFGIVAAYAAIRTKSILMPMIMHFSVNFFSVILQFTNAVAGEKTADIVYNMFLAGLAAAFVLISAVALRKSRFVLPEERDEIKIMKKTKLIWFFNILTLVFIRMTFGYAAESFRFV